MRVRRLERVFFFAEERELLDVAALLGGETRISSEERLFATSPLTGGEERLGPEEVPALLRIPSRDWTGLSEAARASGLAPERLEALAGAGVLVSDREDEPYRTLRRRAESLARDGWDPYAALYHGLGRWDGVSESLHVGEIDEAQARSRRWFEEHRERFGPPPPHFHERADATDRVPLPVPEPAGGLFDLLARRRTEREFDRSRPLALEDFATLARTVYGCHGTQELADGVVVLKRTSPSGGALHPVEAYPLVRDVEGVPPGLYHYAGRTHALERLRALEPEAVEDLIEAIAAGQGYFRSAHAVFVLTARFPRAFWKYREHRKAYRVILLDAGHLSQTLYLACAELGLGAFFTAAVNDDAAEGALGLERFEEAVVGLSGCGPVAPGGTRSVFEPVPFVPGEEG